MVLIDLTIQNSESELNPKTVNKVKRIDELHSEKESAYHQAVDAAISGIDRNNTIKYSIQKAALALEEIYQLHGQEWMMQEIGSIIVLVTMLEFKMAGIGLTIFLRNHADRIGQ